MTEVSLCVVSFTVLQGYYLRSFGVQCCGVCAGFTPPCPRAAKEGFSFGGGSMLAALPCHLMCCDQRSIPQSIGRSLAGWHALKPRQLANHQQSLQDRLTCWQDSCATLVWGCVIASICINRGSDMMNCLALSCAHIQDSVRAQLASLRYETRANQKAGIKRLLVKWHPDRNLDTQQHRSFSTH